MKPLIGIGADVGKAGHRDQAFVFMTYVEALQRAGAVPLLIPPQNGDLESLVDSLDGILLAGGEDCDPSVYGEERHHTCEPMDQRRQSNDLGLARLARERGVPMLGICLGLQVMNIAAGGTLIQDIASEREDALDHASEPSDRHRHDVVIREGTKLAGIVGAGSKDVNSSHHQAIRRVGRSLEVVATAPDGIIEGVEDPAHPFYVGVQWHPEDMGQEQSASALFAAFVDSAAAFQKKRRGDTLS